MKRTIKEVPDSPIYLLGICDKFNEPILATSANKSLVFSRKDIIGLRDFYISQVFPFSSEFIHILLLMDNNKISEIENAKLVLVHENDKEIGAIAINKIEKTGDLINGKFTTRFTLNSVKVPGAFPAPGECSIYLLGKDGNKLLIGTFILHHQPALPLTPERIQALKSDPLVAKYIKIEISCKKCGDTIRIATGIDREGLSGSEIWYEDVPERYKCSCGSLDQDLKYIKNNLHGLLGWKSSPFSLEESIQRNYTHAVLESVLADFWSLLEKSETTEEQLQNFIESNPIVLSNFSSKLLGFKSPINSKFKTDFAILNQKNELLLVEIEKATTILFTKKGAQHSELTHAIGQVENWLQQGRKNKLGLIDNLNIKGLKLDDVMDIRGVVIAGRSLKEYEPFLEKLRVRKDIDFYTYDDLFKFLRKIVSQVEEI